MTEACRGLEIREPKVQHHLLTAPIKEYRQGILEGPRAGHSAKIQDSLPSQSGDKTVMSKMEIFRQYNNPVSPKKSAVDETL